MTDAHPKESHRERARRILDALPAACTYDDILRTLAFDRQIRRGLADLAGHRVLTTDSLRRRLRSWQD